MKTITILLLIASVALNVCFFAGCRSLHDAVYGNLCMYGATPPATDSGKSELVRIAGLLGIKTSGKSASDLSSDIRYKLDRSIDVPNAYDAKAFDEMKQRLNPKQEEKIQEYQRFISDLQGKRVIVIEPEQ